MKMRGSIRRKRFPVLGLVPAFCLACGGSPSEPSDPEVPILPPVPAGTILIADDMDNENGGQAMQNYAGFASWVVVDGCVDLHGPGSIDPRPGNGLYVDMDGSCGRAGTIESRQALDLPVGTYAVECVLAGNSQAAGADTMVVSVGELFRHEIVLDWTQPFHAMRLDFDVASAATARMRVQHLGGDDQGILIDAIRLRRTGS